MIKETPIPERELVLEEQIRALQDELDKTRKLLSAAVDLLNHSAQHICKRIDYETKSDLFKQ